MIDSRNDNWNDSTTGTSSQTDADPAAIEADIRRTQDEMSRTVDRIGDQLTPRSIMNALFDKAEANDIDARMLMDGARRNPLALAMIAGGTLWLISDRDANLPKKRTSDHQEGDGYDASGRAQDGNRDQNDNSRDYVAHMERVEWRDGEDDASYRRRRDIARSNYFMMERGHEEEEGSFRNRLDEATNQFRDKRSQMAEQARNAGAKLRERGADVASQARHTGAMMRDRGSELAGQAKHMLDEHPVIGGLIAATAGAALATTMPITRMENEQLSGVGRRARSMLDEQKDKLMGAAREKKDEMVHRAEDAAHHAEPASS